MQHEWYGTTFVSSVCINCGRTGPGPIDECPGPPDMPEISTRRDLGECTGEDLAAAKRRLRIDRWRIEAMMDAITNEELRRSIKRSR